MLQYPPCKKKKYEHMEEEWHKTYEIGEGALCPTPPPPKKKRKKKKEEKKSWFM